MLAPPFDTTRAANQVRLDGLAFADKPALTRLLDAFYRRAARPVSPRRLRDFILWRALLEMALQGNSAHPGDATALAAEVSACLTPPRPKPLPAHLATLRDLLIDSDGRPCAGFNALRLVTPAVVAAHEHQRAKGAFEIAYKEPVKYRAQIAKTKTAPDFAADWERLKATHPVADYRDKNGLIRRSPNPEYNWRKKSRTPAPRTPAGDFQLAFDFFCWKWFLWGMRGDEPLVEQLFYAFTPYGTQIFIPGYWSLDPMRDIQWSEIKKLHQARGMRRNGMKLDLNREERTRLAKRVGKLRIQGARRGLKGRDLIDFIIRETGLSPETDPSYIYKLSNENP